MKNKLLTIVIIIIGVVAIALGLLISNNDTAKKEKKEESVKKDENYIKHYNTSSQQEDGEFSGQKKDDIKGNYKTTGFDNVKCDDNTCTLSKPVGNDSKHEDSLVLTFKEDVIEYMNVRLLYLSDSFDSSTATNDLNTIINNYYGYKLDQSVVSKGLEELKKKTDAGNYYIELKDGEYLVTYVTGKEDNYYFCSVQIVKQSDYYN